MYIVVSEKLWKHRVFSEHPNDKMGLICNTKKDEGIRLHHRSAGVFHT